VQEHRDNIKGIRQQQLANQLSKEDNVLFARLSDMVRFPPFFFFFPFLNLFVSLADPVFQLPHQQCDQ